jgi:uncharacterized peroxidase-related enzyme
MPTEQTSEITMEPIYLPGVENNPQPSAYLDLINAVKSDPGFGGEYWQIWHLLAFRPEMTIHLGRFTHAVMYEEGPIAPSLRELIATYTSSLNNCQFCMRSHAAVTTHLLNDAALVQAVIQDLESAPIPESEKALLRFVRKVTLESAKIVREDMQPLYAHGWDDAAIYYAITVSALFNFYNRWINATGVHPVSAENHTLHAAKIAARGYIR